MVYLCPRKVFKINILIIYAPHRNFSCEMFGGLKKTPYLCRRKSEKKNILIIYADRKTAERSDAATCKDKAQPSASWGNGWRSRQGSGEGTPQWGCGAKPLPPELPG